MRFTLDSIFKVTFDYDVGTLQPGLPNIPFAQAFEITNEITSSRLINPIWKLNRALKIGSERVLLQSAKDVDEFIYGVIEAKKAEMANSKTDLLSVSPSLTLQLHEIFQTPSLLSMTHASRSRNIGRKITTKTENRQHSLPRCNTGDNRLRGLVMGAFSHRGRAIYSLGSCDWRKTTRTSSSPTRTSATRC